MMLEQVSERVFYAPGGVNIGVITGEDGKAVMVDAGLNDTAARKVLRWVGEAGMEVAAIVTTHCHADHFGGNRFVVSRTGARVWAPTWDEAVLRYPMFQPLCLFAGADPPESLRGGFLLADPSPVDVIYDAGPLEIAGVELQAISLAGHSGNQMGLLVDDVFFCADVVFPERVLERYKIPYLYSVRDHLASLDRAARVPYTVAIPGHGDPTSDLTGLIERNASVVRDIADLVVEITQEPVIPEEALAILLEEVGASPQDAASYYLLHPTIFAFLTYLEVEGRVTHAIERGRSLWRAAA